MFSTHYTVTTYDRDGNIVNTAAQAFNAHHAAEVGEPAEQLRDGLPLGKAQRLCAKWTRRTCDGQTFHAITKL